MTTTLLPSSGISGSSLAEQRFAGHPARAVGCQKHRNRCDVAWLAHPAERCLLRRHPLEVAADDPLACVPSVCTTPGLMAFTRIFRGPSSFASTRVMASTALFVAA
jgi:hypothetical protein